MLSVDVDSMVAKWLGGFNKIEFCSSIVCVLEHEPRILIDCLNSRAIARIWFLASVKAFGGESSIGWAASSELSSHLNHEIQEKENPIP